AQRIHSKKDVPDFILDLICTRNHVHLKNGRMRFAERKAIWVLLHEIFINEEYFFESETESPRILDCGTHIGMAIYYFKTLFPKSRVTGFEPVPAIREIAESNIAENGFEEVEILPYALGSEEGETEMVISANDSMAASTMDRGGNWLENGTRITVPRRKLSSWLEEPVHFLKLDIEGPEVEVLEECGEKLSHVKTLFCEYHQGEKLPANRLARLLGVLTENGFDVQVGKSYSYQQSTEYRPANFLEGSYSGVLWAKNLNWKDRQG
ncbi:MAG: FkbM family methyltransferase, partial [Candidatus Omnitrophica bacterium]|nr:FkbM family methyltransferase [Candidatus Omnitrophota bacterium]